MSWFYNLRVQRKLGFAMLLTSTIALVLACGVILAVEYVSYRGSLIRNVTTLARISADNSTAAIAFDDPTGAKQNLEALRAEPQITSATLYDSDGQVFAHYSSGVDKSPRDDLRAAVGVRFENGEVVAVQPVAEGSRRLGTLYLHATMERIYVRMRTYTLVVLGVLAASFGLAGLIASWLGRSLARPIVELAGTASAVSANQDYSLRAHQYGRDELGQLTATFNAMLEKTQTSVAGLRESEWAHRELVRALPTAAYMCDAQGVVTIYNEAAVNLCGRTPVVGRDHWWDLYPTAYQLNGQPLARDQYPAAEALREGRPVRGVEIIIERPDGTRRNVLPHPEPIRDTAGKLIGIVNMLVDITEQKRETAAARQLAAIVESSDDAIISKDLNGIIVTWNRGAEVLFGYTAGQTVGQSIALLIPLAHLDEEPEIIDRIRRGERVEQYETVRRRRDGSLVEVSLTVSPIRNSNGQIVGASKIARNITARKQAERQADFLSRLSQQLSAVVDPGEIILVASRLVGEQLKTDRCYFFTLADDVTRVRVGEDWSAAGFQPLRGEYHTADFGTPELWQALQAGPLAVDDKTTHPLTRNLGSGYDPLRIRAHVSVPFLREGKWIASLTVADEKPRSWRKDEMALLENALARVWPMVERARTQRELQESERRQRNLMRALPVPCYTLDLQGRLTFSNDAARQLWGIAPPLGETLWGGSIGLATLAGAPLAPEDAPVAVALREQRSVRGVEIFVVRPDGSQRWVVPHPDPIFDAHGVCTGVIDVVQDVTEERTAQNKIEKVAERLSLAINSANLGDWTWDAQTDVILLSPRTSEIYGVPADSNVTRSQMRRLLHPEDRARSQQALARAIELHTDYDIEYRVIRPDGTMRWVAAKGRSLFGKDGRVWSMVGVVQDITENKLQVLALEDLSRQIKTQAQLFDATLSNITDLAYSFDLQGRWMYANRPLLDLWNRSLEEISGKTSLELGYPPQLAARLLAEVKQVIATKTPVRGETAYTAADGTSDDHEYIFSPVMDASGTVTAVVGTTRLITARKRAENELKRARDEALDASRAKDDFLAALSHELRTPLNPVLLLASDAAQNTNLPDEVRADFELIRKNVDLEARLIDDLLDLTRITRGKLQLDRNRCDVHAILQDALANVRADRVEKQQELKISLAASEHSVLGDSVRLQQIFWNILKNAVKFTPAKGTLSVETSLSAGADRLIVKISDTGLGMTAEEIDRAFQAFSQGEHATNDSSVHRFGGLGLGLSITKKLLDLHEGVIRATSAGRNQGSTFVIELPLCTLPLTQPKPSSSAATDSVRTTNPPMPVGTQPSRTAVRKILLVEDHAPTRQTLQRLLAARQFEVTPAASAAEAIRLARIGQFDLVISDVGLPDRTGYDLMTELRSLKPALMGIALSGYGMEEDLARSQAAGFTAHLVKPVTIGMLESTIVSLPPLAS